LLLRVFYVTDPANNDKINWSFGENMMTHLKENIFPSIQRLNLSAHEVAKVNAPVLKEFSAQSGPLSTARGWRQLTE
jgi:hypothetical protein